MLQNQKLGWFTTLIYTKIVSIILHFKEAQELQAIAEADLIVLKKYDIDNILLIYYFY
jgi:hypothetical protein